MNNFNYILTLDQVNKINRDIKRTFEKAVRSGFNFKPHEERFNRLQEDIWLETGQRVITYTVNGYPRVSTRNEDRAIVSRYEPHIVYVLNVFKAAMKFNETLKEK